MKAQVTSPRPDFGGPITYPASPPAAGDHRDRWACYACNFHEVADRPEVDVLVHNLEHGHNVLGRRAFVAGQLVVTPGDSPPRERIIVEDDPLPVGGTASTTPAGDHVPRRGPIDDDDVEDTRDDSLDDTSDDND